MNPSTPARIAATEASTVLSDRTHSTAAPETPSPASSKRTKNMAAKERVLAQTLADEPKDLEGYQMAWDKLRKFMDETFILARPEPLSVSSFTRLDEVAELFNLHVDMATALFEEPKRSKVPQYLEDNFARISTITNPKKLNNEAFSRTILDQILISALYEESNKKLNQQPESEDSNHTHTHPPVPDTNEYEEPAELELLHETRLQKDVNYKGQHRLLSGFADYSIWYESMARQTMATNLLIVEAKRQFYTDAAIPQLACYMGIVHTYRKEESRDNCIVYGFTSDGETFRFCQIDNKGVFRVSNQFCWRQQKDQIFYLVRHLLRAAALSSPTTSPIKDPEERKIILSSFCSLGLPPKYDLPDDDPDSDMIH